MKNLPTLALLVCAPLYAGDTPSQKELNLAAWREQTKWKGQPPGPGLASRIALDSSRALLALTDTANTVALIDLKTGKVRARLTGHRNRIIALNIAADGTLSSLDVDGVLKRWDAEKAGQEAKTKSSRNLGLRDIQNAAFSIDGKRLVTNGARLDRPALASQFQVWDLTAAKKPWIISPHSFGAYAAVFTADGKFLWTRGGTIAKPTAKTGSFTDLTVSEAKLFDLTKAREVKTLANEPGIFRLEPAPDGKHFAIISYAAGDKSYYVKVFANGKQTKVVAQFKLGAPMATALAFSSDGQYLAASVGSRGPFDKTAKVEIRMWDWKKSTLVNTLKGHTDDVDSLMFAADGSYLISSSRDGTIRKWGAAKK